MFRLSLASVLCQLPTYIKLGAYSSQTRRFIPVRPSGSWESRKGAGPQTRMVPSSEALAIRPGRTGFQLTQFTVRV